MNDKNVELKPNYLVIPLITFFTAIIGTIFSSAGMGWYNSILIKPEITPPPWIFPIAWNLIFILTTISALIFWNKGKGGIIKKLFHPRQVKLFWVGVGLFIANAVLNVLWSLLFFYLRLANAAFVEMFFLLATVIALIVIIWKTSKWASVLLLPYALWVSFATYLTYLIVLLNS